MKKKDRGYVKISMAKGKQPFRVTSISRNGEPLDSSETFTTCNNAIKNIVAKMKVYGGESVLVEDNSYQSNPKAKGVLFILHVNGKKLYQKD